MRRMSIAPGTGHHDHDATLDDTFDFVNTLRYDQGPVNEELDDLGSVVTWLADHELLHAEKAVAIADEASRDPAGATATLQHVRSVRDALREVSDAVVERRAPAQRALDRINRALRAREVIELTGTDDGVTVGHRHVGDPLDDALARLATALVEELTDGRPERIRVCAQPTCRWVFYDASPTARRRWCDMTTCGNRAKAARHRARRRGVTGAL